MRPNDGENMARCTFIWLDSNGDPDATKNVALMSVTKDGSPHSTTFVAIGDGSYYFNYTATGKYTISYNSVEQDEFKDMELPGEDILLTSNLASSPSRGKVQSSGGELFVYTDGSSNMLHAGDLATSLNTNDATKPAASSLTYSLNEKIKAIGGVGSITKNRRIVYFDSQVATAADGNEAGSPTEYQTTSGTNEIKIRFPFYKLADDKVLIIVCQIKTAGSSDGYLYLATDGDFINEADLYSSWTSWTDFSHTEDISGYDFSVLEVTVGLAMLSGTGPVYMRNVMILAGPN